ncbi:hypothetical protein FS837_008435 [Tulasnella sp. UAMH 9824]|nr:hypothetical protein FS837_008435 [Tulasnella sp. UAMH 9824]
MRLSTLTLLPLLAQVFAQERPQGASSERFNYQSDVARLRKIVIESLYSHRDVFLRELVSNANDAIEKWRVVSLGGGIVDPNPLNITLKLVPGENDRPGKLIITDTGIGMTPEELTKNLGTLAKSGTSEFLAKAEADKGKDKDAAANLIGQFGLGFYSSFLVADEVYVSSLAPPTKENPNPVQHVFYSASDAQAFDVYPDPRGQTLDRGTEITLILKDDAKEYLEEQKIRELIMKHSAFSTAYPIYLWATKSQEVPLQPGDEGYVDPEAAKAEEKKEEEPKEKSEDVDEDEVVIEDAPKKEEEPAPEIPQTKTITFNDWDHLNNQPPIWMKDPKTVTEQEMNEFYMATFKDHNHPIAYHHFKGDTGSGTSFRALIFIPPDLPKDYWASPKPTTDSIRLFVKRVFITNDLGDAALPKWISWLRAIIDADDLPLNVSRETLQTTKFMAQAKAVVIKRFIQLMTRIVAEHPQKYDRMMKQGYGPILKLGAIESPKDRTKLMRVIKFDSNLRKGITLDEYVEKRKKGQEQIFFLAGAGEDQETLAKSVHVEKLSARGYEVLFLTDPMDEMLFQALKTWKEYRIQDVAKDGLQFGDEEEAEEKKFIEEKTEEYKPLITFLKDLTKDVVTDVVVSTRLISSPCAIVADTFGYSGNMQKIMSAQHHKDDNHQAIVTEWAMKQRKLEINPSSPLITGMLAKVKVLDDVEEGEEKDKELQDELNEIAKILVDGALVRSGFAVPDSIQFFDRVDRVLRRSLGVSETAKADVTVKPAPDQEESEEKIEEAKEKRAKSLPDMDAPEDLSNVIVTDDLPFDPSKAVDIEIDDHGSGKVGLVQDTPTGAEWDDESHQRLQEMLKNVNGEKTEKHDEL